MILHVILQIIDPLRNLPNPFSQYEYGLWISIAVELCMILLAIDVVDVTKRGVGQKPYWWWVVGILFVFYYIPVYFCFFIESLLGAICLSLVGIVIVNLIFAYFIWKIFYILPWTFRKK
jgi:hypothetical protein